MPRLLAFAVLLCGAAACGPVQSTAYLMDAEVQLEAARTANAEERAPYEWTAANLYLHKAREEVGYADYEAAVSYAGKAKRLATEARERAMGTGRASEPPTSSQPQVTPVPQIVPTEEGAP